MESFIHIFLSSTVAMVWFSVVFTAAFSVSIYPSPLCIGTSPYKTFTHFLSLVCLLHLLFSDPGKNSQNWISPASERLFHPFSGCVFSLLHLGWLCCLSDSVMELVWGVQQQKINHSFKFIFVKQLPTW